MGAQDAFLPSACGIFFGRLITQPSARAIMQNPGDAVVEYARTTSVGVMWARINSRTKAAVTGNQLVQAEDWAGTYKLTRWNTKWFFSDNILFASLLLPGAWVWIMNKVPK